MDSRTKSRIVSALRKINWGYPPREDAKKKRKVAPATFQCEHCNLVIYTGSKSLVDADLSHFKRVIKDKVYMDHIQAVVPPEGFKEGKDWCWDQYIERMFCSAEGFQLLCQSCHDSKTFLENELRDQYKKQKKRKK